MNRKRLRLIENIIMLTFPVVLFAGCAGSDIKPTNEDQLVASYSDYDNPLPETDLMNNSTAYEVSTRENPEASEQSFLDQSATISQLPMNDSDDNFSQDGTKTTPTVVQASRPVLELPTENVFRFSTDKYELADDQKTELEQHAKFLIANPQMTLVINGHADARGTENYNQALSEKRAQAVYDFLVGLGVTETQLKKFGFGEHFPKNDENNWEENRRVELEFSKQVVVSSMQ